MDKIRIAIATKGYDGLNDTVSNTFGKTKTFTLVDVENGKIKHVQIIDNLAADYNHGSGPIATKTLAELKVNAVITSQLGPGASELLFHNKITPILVEPNIKASDAIEKVTAQPHKQPKKG
ncbi:MAG: hypothetical protein NWF09_02410 [Candidatus Bathyarchaeota archaeon]|nr:hypothetical protein [Candidatus Bathyarchaeota archaeon]